MYVIIMSLLLWLKPKNGYGASEGGNNVALLTSLMQRVAGSTVTNDRQHGARGGMYGAHEH